MSDTSPAFCSRFTTLNDPDSSDWTALASPSTHYGKFGLDPDQTLQLWEPDSQERIKSLVDTYVAARDAGVPSGGGLAFAINIDQSMFDVFTSRTLSGDDARGFDLVIDDSAGGSAPVLTKAPDANNRFSVSWGGGADERSIETSDGSFEAIAVSSASPPSRPRFASSAGDDAAAAVLIAAFHESHGEPRHAEHHVHDGTMIMFLSDADHVYGASAPLSPPASSSAPPAFAKLGLASHFSSNSLDDQLLLLTEGGHCYNSHSHNTRNIPLVCRPKTHPHTDACPQALDYSLGSFANFAAWIEADHDAALTPCNE
jgi:hypothetical protein